VPPVAAQLTPVRRTGTRLALALWLCLGCSHDLGPGVVHVVQPGETLYRIAHYYQVPASTLIEINEIGDVEDMRVGRRLWIPGAPEALRPGGPLPIGAEPGMVARPEVPESTPRTETVEREFVWPLVGRITSPYGPRRPRFHEGIDIAAPSGTLIRAAEAGRVIHSGRLGEYGNAVLVRHDRHLVSVYAHNRRNRVKKGAFVDRGDVVAEVGATGNATGPHLHFEVRRDERADDPLRYLP
jgi:murein DD-endopeptidase MepM/ murein hydrolase activator NlpD